MDSNPPTPPGGNSEPVTNAPERKLPCGTRIAVVLFSHYPSDPRPRRAAEALAEQGATVEVICLRSGDHEPASETCHGVRVQRLSLQRKRNGALRYLWEYSAFLLASFFLLGMRSIKKRYDLVHVHNMPDFLVFSALVPKARGAKVILDLHDPMPELMQSIFNLGPNSGAVRLLKRVEKWSIGFADAVVTVNEACKKIFSSRSCPPEKIRVIMNSPNAATFPLRPPPRCDAARGKNSPFVIMYHGSLVERHGLDLAVSALEKIKPCIPSAELRIYGRSTPFLEQVLAGAQASGLGNSVRYLGPKTLAEIVEAIRDCHIGIIPNRRSIFTEINTPTRIFEYLSQGKPVIAPRTPGILDYFGPRDLIYFELGDASDLAAKLGHAFTHPKETLQWVERGQAVYAAHQWSDECGRFIELVQRLLQPSKF